MRVQITERHCNVPSNVLERTEQQLDGLEKYDARASSADVVYEEEKHLKKTEIIVHIDGAEPVIATGRSPEFRTSLDQALDRLRRQLRKQRKRRREHQAPPTAERVTQG